jgi:hypothetical protein
MLKSAGPARENHVLERIEVPNRLISAFARVSEVDVEVILRHFGGMNPYHVSSPHLMRRLWEIIVDRLLLGLISRVAEQRHVVVDLGLQVHRALPDFVDIF